MKAAETRTSGEDPGASDSLLAAPAAGPRVAVVGAGLMGRWHADAATRAGGEIVGICDSNREAARALATRMKVRCFEGTLDDLLAKTKPDVVHICTPLGSHRDLSERALMADADVIVEKPLASDAGETEGLLTLASERQRVLCPVHQLVFQPWLGLVQRVGELLSIDYSACSAGALDRGARDADEVADEILSHPLALFERLLSRAQLPSATDSSVVRGEAVDLGALQWSAERSAPGELRAHAIGARVALSLAISLRGRPPRHELQLTGSQGTLHADLFHGFAWHERATTSRAYKIARPFSLAGHQIAGAAVNLARRAARSEPAYPGLRSLVAQLYASRASHPAVSPLSAHHTLAVARARDAILAAS